MNLQEYKTVIAVLDVGMGCSHMANLIATSPFLADRTDDPTVDYINSIRKYYKAGIPNAHVNPVIAFIDNILEPELYGLIEKSKLPFVLGGHIQSIHGKTGDAVKKLGRTLILLGVTNTPNEIIQLRAGPEFVNYFKEHYKTSELVNKSHFSKDDIIEFDPNLLFSPDITELVNLLNEKLDLKLDINLCQELHSMWFNNITKILKGYKK